MHVVQLLHALLRGPNLEVVETRLPEGCLDRSLSKKIYLPRIVGPALGQQRASSALFQNLHDLRRSANSRFAQEQVNVFRHHDIADDDEPVTQSSLF